jgi:hypothetical protein
LIFRALPSVEIVAEPPTDVMIAGPVAAVWARDRELASSELTHINRNSVPGVRSLPICDEAAARDATSGVKEKRP